MKIEPGELVLNLGSGIGIDSVALILKSWSRFQVVNMDVALTALEKAVSLASRFNPAIACSLSWVAGDAELIPFRRDCFDWVFMNGVFNLFRQKEALLSEIKRIMKPSASLIIVDLCSNCVLPDYFDNNPDAWAWCMSGAHTRERVLELLDKAGLEPGMNAALGEKDMFYRAVFLARKRSSRA